jgi:hypothetical protein
LASAYTHCAGTPAESVPSSLRRAKPSPAISRSPAR